MTATKNDAELLRCYVEDRSEPAFTELVRRHIGLVYSVALRRVGGDAHLAEDVAQKVFCDLARKAASLTGRATLSSWLYVSVHVASAAFVRGEQRRKRRETEAHAMETMHSDPKHSHNEGAWMQLRPVLDDVIIELKEEEREAVVLRFFEKRSFAEIGAALSVTDEAARKRVDRTLEKLRAIFARRGITSTTAALGLALAAVGTSVVPVDVTAKIAGTALAHGAAATGSASAVLTALKSVAPIAAVIVGGMFFINEQREANRALSAELTRLDETNRGIAGLRDENHRLARLATEIDELRRAQTELPVLRAALSESTPAPPATAVVGLNAAGAISWDKNFVSLREFLERLQALGSQPSGKDARITLRFDPTASASAIRYVVEEARKAQINLWMVPNGPISPSVVGSWF